MPSQQDLDQGGSVRQVMEVYMGPSVGWQLAAQAWILDVTATGTSSPVFGTSLVRVSVNANGVVIQLPLAKGNGAGAGAVPGTYTILPMTIVDIGGFANSHPITIQAAGSETIDGFTSITLSSNFAAAVLLPNVTSGGWTLTQ